MKLALTFGAAAVLASTLAGCVVVPAEPVPVVYAPPRAAVVVRPAYRPHHYHYRGYYPYRDRYWR